MCKRERDPPCPLSLDIYCKQEMLLPGSPERESQSFPSATAVLGIADSAPHWGSTVEQWTLTNQHVWTKGHTVWLTGTHTTISMMRFAVLYFVLFCIFYFTMKFYSFLGGRVQGKNSGDRDERDQGCMVQDSQSIKLQKNKKNPGHLPPSCFPWNRQSPSLIAAEKWIWSEK